jgi:predicted unusual protein kinase regulating ubiquinone biosynthesis (AarF/ABC1/UbiB family)
MCAANKGVYIKLGQHIAMLGYLIPYEYQVGEFRELSL